MLAPFFFVNNYPSPPTQQAKIGALAVQVLATRAAAPTAALEQHIDALVADRYGLSAAEVALLGG